MSLLSYTIAACSSEDEQHPARELQSFHSQSRGWQSAHFCDFPQELLLRFNGCASVQQVQLLSHQFKIATRVELFIGKLAPGTSEPPARGVAGVTFTRLGHFSLDGNERSKFQARELKTVYVPRLAEGHFLRLLLHRCHINEHNLYNQLGVLAIRVVGTGGVVVGAREPDPPPVESLVSMAERPPATGKGGPRGAPAIDGGVMSMLQDLFAAKDAAVGAEDYEEAKRLKVAIEELRAVGVRLCELERKKIAAVAREDYDAAKLIKDELQDLRSSAGVPLPPPPPPPLQILPADLSPFARRAAGGAAAARHPSESDDPARDYGLQAAQDRINRMAQQALAPSAAGRGEEYVPPHRQVLAADEDSLPLPESPVTELERLASSEPARSPPQPAAPAPQAKATPEGRAREAVRQAAPPAPAPPAPPAPEAPAPVLSEKAAAGRGATGFLGGVRRATNQREHDERPIGAARPPPPEATSSAEASDDSPPAEPLSAADRKEALSNGLLDLFGEELVAGLYSRTWSVRQAAMTRVAAAMPSKAGQKRALVAGAVRVMLLGAADKMVNVFLASLEVEAALLATPLRALCSAADAERELRPLLERWRDKLADSNARVREGAESGLLALCSAPEIGPATVGALLAAPLPPSKRNSSQAWVGRLAPLKRLLREHGGALAHLVTPSLKLVKEALGSASGQVRAEATEVAHELYALVADVGVFSRHLADLKPALRDPLLEALERGRPAAQSFNGRASANKGAGRNSLGASVGGPNQALDDEEEAAIEPDQCQFCMRRDPAWESEEALDLHFWKECPMLSSCDQCAQVVECVSLNEHLITECDCSKPFRYPPPLGQHVEYYGCPFCGQDLPQDADELRQHLMHDCAANPRRAG